MSLRNKLAIRAFDDAARAHMAASGFPWQRWGKEDDCVVPCYVLTASDVEDPLQAEGEDKTETIAQLEAMFLPEDRVCYNFRFEEKKDGSGKMEPSGWGHSDRTRSELARDLEASSDIGEALGDFDPRGGGLVHVNPMSGKGIGDDDVTACRHAVVECDVGAPEYQLRKLEELRLPCSAVVYSANRSIHAAVRVDAEDRRQFDNRVAFLYGFCTKHGLQVDTACGNPSRMMRIAGVTRNGVRQSLIATNTGLGSWDEWHSWASGGSMPAVVNFGRAWGNLPPLAPERIGDVLRDGHKMIVSGPSKAGKTFLLMNLAIAVAEGGSWLGHGCRQGKVLYVNLEVDAASCLNRFASLYAALGLGGQGAASIDVLNLRGHAKPLDKLLPDLLGVCEDKGYAVVIMDPIYKVITGDENSATDMALFVRQLDIIAERGKCCVVYAHHHSKGRQGSKRSMDRASGSGVFGRDPDAILDLAPLECTPELRALGHSQEIRRLLRDSIPAFDESACPSDPEIAKTYVRTVLDESVADAICDEIDSIYAGPLPPAFQLNYDLREFASPKPTNLWFAYPLHVVDTEDALAECKVEGAPGRPFTKKNGKGEAKSDPCDDLGFVFALLSMGQPNVSIKDIAAFLEVSERTAQRRIDKDGGFERKSGLTWKVA